MVQRTATSDDHERGAPPGRRPPATRATSARRLCALAPIALLALAGATLPSGAGAAAVDLGTADTFSVLGGSAVTNTGPSVLAGDLGLSPGTAVTGFPPGTVLGAVHANDAVALQAKSDLVTAYDDAAGRSSSATIAGDLAGLTLTTGVYTSATSLGLSGDLTLDAQGDPDAVFVFQAGSTLTTAGGSRVLLSGGAQACNVFWQVGSSATLGTASAFTGTILALTSISLTTAATVDGSVLARNGAVTLDTNVFVDSTCTPPEGDGTTPPPGTPGAPGGPAGSGGPGAPGGPAAPGNPGGSGAPGGPAGRAAPGTTAPLSGSADDAARRAAARRRRASAIRRAGLAALITTRPASRIACDAAQLRGTVRAGAAASRYWFEFGTTRRYGRTTASDRTDRGARVVAVHAQAPRLLPGTTYHYRLISTRADGRRTYGSDRSFGTSGPRACTTQVEPRAPSTPQGFTG